MLDRLDHHVKEVLRIPGYVRYMDDFVLFAPSKARLVEAHGALRAFLQSPLGLQEKEQATVLAPVREGLPFLGWRIYPALVRLRRANLRRVRARVRHRQWQQRHGLLDEAALIASLRSVFEHLRQGHTTALRRRWLERLGPVFTGPAGLRRGWAQAPRSA